MHDPYQSPVSVVHNQGAYNDVRTPAIALIAVSVFAIAIGGLALIGDIVLLATGAIDEVRTPDSAPFSERTALYVRMVWGTLMVFASCFIAYGGISMLRLKRYSLSITAAIIAIIPCLGPCFVFGMPFGIWAFIVLRTPAVKDLFR